MDIKREPPKKRGRYIAIAIGVVAILGTTVMLSNLESRPPSVERATLWIDSVDRGPFVRQVRAPGTLVPEHIRYVTAVTSGRVEALPMRPGTQVQPNTLLLELTNPDVQLEALNAQRALADAEANLVATRTNLETQRLNQQSLVAQVRTQHAQALRDAAVNEALYNKKLASDNEVQKARDLAKELEERIKIEEQRLKVQTDAIQGQLALAGQNVGRLRAIVAFQEQKLASMKVLAGEGGQLLMLGNGSQQLELGQWVLAGQTLATIAQPGRLKAQLRVPETQAKDVAIGQKAEVDTRNGIVQGHVIRADPGAVNGTVLVEVALDGELPKGARADLSVDANIEIERLQNVLHVGRPAYGQPESTVGIFKLDPDGKNATRVNVKLGRASVSTIEVVSGLNVKDKVIISDMSQWDNVQRVRLQ